jgi:tRNA threonylcarbamoyladenosine biosynthesis protein TsaE
MARAARARTVRRVSGAWRCLSKSVADTDRLGRRIGRALQGGEIIALYGELGSGKTALVRGMAAGLGASPQSVSSPTFVLIHEYHGRLRLAHADLYRLDSAAELRHIGLSDYDDGRTVTAIEWAGKAGDELPADRLEIHLRHRSPDVREIAFVPGGDRARRLLARVRVQRLAGRTAGQRRQAS